MDRAHAFQKTDRFRDAKAMQNALRHAYELVEKRPLPGAQRVGLTDVFADDPAPESASPMTTSQLDLAVSVVFDPDPNNESLVVDIEDTTGKQERFQLRSKSDPALRLTDDDQTVQLAEVSVVELPPD